MDDDVSGWKALMEMDVGRRRKVDGVRGRRSSSNTLQEKGWLGLRAKLGGAVTGPRCLPAVFSLKATPMIGLLHGSALHSDREQTARRNTPPKFTGKCYFTPFKRQKGSRMSVIE